MCKIEGCERHEFDYTLCLPHLKEVYGLIHYEVAPKPKRKSRKKKVEAVEVTTTDDTNELETR